MLITSTAQGWAIWSVLYDVRKQEGELKAAQPHDKVHDLMQITRLYTVFDITDDEALAVKSFAQSAAATPDDCRIGL